MKIIIGADLVPSASDVNLFVEGNSDALVGKELKDILDSADFRIFNLETALCDEETPTKKEGANIWAPTASIKGYNALGVNLLTISNNHVMDHGRKGFVSTLDTLNAAGIDHVGGGFTKEEAMKPYIFEKDGVKVGVYACCEHEFSWIEDYGCGSNGFDPLESLDHIVELKKQVDYCIVLYHGGKEEYRYPSPYLRKVCRRIVDKGADLVLCQHTHCVGAEEDYKGSKIVYGQGNFLFNTYALIIEQWRTSLLVSLDLTKDGVKIDYIPIETDGCGTRYSHNEEILDGFYQRSEEIKQEGFIESSFEDKAANSVMSRFKSIFGADAALDKVKEKGVSIANILECEVHREMMLTGIKVLNKLGKYGETKLD